MPNVKQMQFNNVEDWASGEFYDTHTANPRGALTIGWPVTAAGIEKFLYRFASSSGDKVKNETDERQEATISGSFSWEELTGPKRHYLRLSGGSVSIPVSTSWGPDNYVMGVLVRISEYPSGDMLLIGNPTGIFSIYLTSDGYIKVPNVPGKEAAISKKRFPKNQIVSVTLATEANSGRFLGFHGFMNGAYVGTVESSTFNVSKNNIQIGPGHMDIFEAWLLKGDYKTRATPIKEGAWVSEIFDIGYIQRLTAISIRGNINKSHVVKCKASFSETPNLAALEEAQFQTNEPTTYIVPNMVHGQYGQVTIEMASLVPEDLPVIENLTLHFGDYPYLAPVHFPSSVVPEEDIQATGLPEQDDIQITAGDVSSPSAITAKSKELDLIAKIGNTQFQRKIRPRKGWPEFARLSNRNCISPYNISPPLWYLGPLLTPTPILGQPLVTEEGAILAHGESDWFAWDGFGKELWFRSCEYPIIGEGTTNNKFLFFPTTHDIRCVDLRDGSLVWVYSPSASPSGMLALLENGSILAPLIDGKLIFLSVSGLLIKEIDSGFGGGFHLDSAYVDTPYTETYHVDFPAKYENHSDYSDHTNWTDTYSAGSSEIFYTVGGIDIRGSHTNHKPPDGIPLVVDQTEHANVAHTDVTHGDTSHSDSVHADEPYSDVTVEESSGRGVQFTDEGFGNDILLVFPAFAIVLDQDGTVVSVISSDSRITAAVVNDDIGQDGSTLRLVHAGFADGYIKTFAAETGAVLFERELDSSVQFVINVPFKGIPLLVGTENKLYLLDQRLETSWELNLPSNPSGWPSVAGDNLVVSLQDRILVVSPYGVVVNEVLPQEELTGSPVIMKTGTLLAPSERGLLVYGSFTRAPFIGYQVWPKTVHTKEQFYLIDRSSEILGEIANVRWIVRGEQLDGPIQGLSIDQAGTYEIVHAAWNRLGQKAEEKISLRVYPSFVEERPLVWEMEHQAVKHVSGVVKSEDELRIFYPDEGLSEVYQDQPVQIDLEIFGAYRDITDASILFVLKEAESSTAEAKLSINGVLVEPEAGRARIEISPTDWKKVLPGTYYWGIYITYPSGRVELGGRGRIEVRAALA